jgi:hypothetical protein
MHLEIHLLFLDFPDASNTIFKVLPSGPLHFISICCDIHFLVSNLSLHFINFFIISFHLPLLGLAQKSLTCIDDCLFGISRLFNKGTCDYKVSF